MTIFSVILILALSVAAISFADAIAPRGRQHNYGPLAGLGVGAFFVAYLIESLLARGGLAQISDPTAHAFADAFIGAALPEETLKLAAFLIWLFFQQTRQPRNALVGAVAMSVAFHAVESVLKLGQMEPYPAIWLLLSLVSVFKTIFLGASGFAIGIWTAIAVGSGGRRSVICIGGAYVAAVLVHGLWDAGAMLGKARLETPGSSREFTELILPLMLGSIAVQCAAISLGIWKLNRSDTPLRWPPRFAWS
jgi:RsiW-degrading membrane proteinase PrsW (M82 family)